MILYIEYDRWKLINLIMAPGSVILNLLFQVIKIAIKLMIAKQHVYVAQSVSVFECFQLTCMNKAKKLTSGRM